MTKILRIINRFNLGGPTYNAAYLTRYLSPEFETLLIGGVHDIGEESSDFILNDLGVQFRKIQSMKRSVNFSQDREAYREIRKIIREYNPDIVHTHASKAGALGRMAASAENVPHIVHTFHGHVFHSYFGKMKTLFYKSVERRLAKKSDCIIAISPIQKEELSVIHKICPPEKIRVIPLGFDLERFVGIDPTQKMHSVFRSDWHLGDDEIAVGIIGRLAPIKNHKLFIRAIRSVKCNTQNLRAFIIGDGELKAELQNEINSLGMSWTENRSVDADFCFCGWMRNIEEPLEGLDIVALTSLNEGTPVSLIEAQASSVPVVSTNVGGVKDIIPKELHRYICPSEDEKQLANAIEELASSTEMRINAGKSGKEYVQNRYHFTRLVKDHELLYNELLKG